MVVSPPSPATRSCLPQEGFFPGSISSQCMDIGFNTWRLVRTSVQGGYPRTTRFCLLQEGFSPGPFTPRIKCFAVTEILPITFLWCFLIIAAQNCIGKPSFNQKSVLTVNYHTKNQYLAGKGWRVPGMRTPLIALYKMVSHWPINSTTSLEPKTSSMWLGIPCQKWTKKFWTWKLKKNLKIN